MMNRMALESFANSGRRASVGSHIRNGGGGMFNTGGDGDDGLDLFSKTTRRSDGDQIRLDKIAVGPARIGRGMEDLLDCEIGKHDYDWLLTPPETPLYPSAVARENSLSSNSLSREGLLSSTTTPVIARESPLTSTGPRGRATARSVSNTRPSRLSTSQTESSHPTRPVRSSSVTRPSISSSYSSSFSNNNKTSMLNTSSSSISSSRPSTPNSRLNKTSSNATATARPSSSTPIRPTSSSTVSRPSSSSTISRTSSNSSSNARSSSNTRPVINSRPPTPTKSRPNPSSTSATRPVNSRLPTPTRTRSNPSSTSSTKAANHSRPSTPSSSRPQTPSNSNSNSNVVSRVNSRPSTPTRRPTSSGGPSTLTAASRILGTNRVPPSNTRNPMGSGSRPSSPGPRPRAPVRPIDLPDFPTDAPPNLRTKLPDRPASAGRTRPGLALTLRSNSNTDATVQTSVPAASNRRNYAPPVVSKGRFPENQPKGGSSTKLHGSGNGHDVASDNGLRRPAKPASATESTGFGRNISKKSLDMALRHMDIRQGMGGLRASSLFPQSIRSTSSKTRPVRKSNPVVPLSHDEYIHDSHSYTGTISPDCRSSIAFSENGDFAPGSIKSPDRESLATTRDSEFDLLPHGSSRYDAFMLKEDSKNMNWLHSAEDKSDQSPVFDHRFEPLPEPFDLP